MNDSGENDGFRRENGRFGGERKTVGGWNILRFSHYLLTGEKRIGFGIGERCHEYIDKREKTPGIRISFQIPPPLYHRIRIAPFLANDSPSLIGKR